MATKTGNAKRLDNWALAQEKVGNLPATLFSVTIYRLSPYMAYTPVLAPDFSPDDR